MDNYDISATLAPKSDQLNADDLIAGPMTITITDVKVGTGDQPVSIFFKEGTRPYKPCKSMRRVLALAWGTDGRKYIGERLTLFRDPKAKFGKDEVGGIRISHVSGIAGESMVVMLTVSQGKKAPFIVKKIVDLIQKDIERGKIATHEISSDDMAAAEMIAANGTAAFKNWYTSLAEDQQAYYAPAKKALWEMAKVADTEGGIV